MTFDTSVTLELPEELMAACNIRNIDQSLLRKMKARAAEEGLTLRDWCIGSFVKSLEAKHDLRDGDKQESSRGATRAKSPDREQVGRDDVDTGTEAVVVGAPIPVSGHKCFCGAEVFEAKTSTGITKWKCEKGHWSTPKRSGESERVDE